MPQDSLPKRAPIQARLTPEILDDVFWELVDIHGQYQPIKPGAPYPDRSKHPGAVALYDKPVDGSDDRVIRWWSNQPVLQDNYNYSINYGAEDAEFPGFARRYLVRRDQYLVAAYGARFTGVYLIRVDDGGSGYASAPEVTFTGGGGTGAAAEAIFGQDGVISWVRITSNGTSYTSAPTIGFVGGGGSGASATALMQGAAILVHQEVQELPKDDPRSSLFVAVLRVWETIPGKEIFSKIIDTDNGRVITVKDQVVLANTEPDTGDGIISSQVRGIDANRSKLTTQTAEGFVEITGLANVNSLQKWTTVEDDRTHADFYVFKLLAEAGTALPDVDTEFQFDGRLQVILKREKRGFSETEDEWMVIGFPLDQLPDMTYVESVDVGIRFPGIFEFIEQFEVAFTFPYRPPFPGVHYNYLRPRSNNVPARQTHFFTRGYVVPPEKLTIITPGTESRNVPMAEDTVHGAFQWFVTFNNEVVLVENIAASNPPSYDPMEIYVFGSECRRWKGNIWETTVTEASEGKDIDTFPPVQQASGLVIGEYGGGLPRSVDYGTTGFYAVNTVANAKAVQLFGFRGPTWTKLAETTPADAGLVDFGVGNLNTLQYITGDGSAHSDGVSVYVYGEPGQSTIVFGSNPANDDQIKLGFLHGTATYNTTWTFKTLLSENILATGTLTISGVVIDAQTVTIGTRVYEYDSHTVETITSGNVRANISPATGFTTAATGTIEVNAVPSVGQTFVIGSKTFTIVTPGTQVADGDVPYGTDFSTQAAFIFTAINGTDGVNTPHPTVSCGSFAGGGGSTTALLSARAGGTAGNSIVTTSTTGAIVMGAATLASGADCTAANAVTAMVSAINGDTQRLVTAVDGTGNVVDVTSLVGGTAANYATTETMTNGSWGGANLTGGVAATAYQVQRGSTAAETAANFQKAMNASGTAGTEYSTGTLADPILYVPTEVASATFVVHTRISADWTSFGDFQTGGNFEWITDANGAFPVNDFGTVGALTGASNGQLLGTLDEDEHSLIMNQQGFSDPDLKTRNFPPTPDDLTTGALLVGNRDMQLWFGQFGRMPVKYQKSVDGSTNWIDGDVDLNAASVYPAPGTIRKVGITDFADAEPYRYIRLVISTSPANGDPPPESDYGPGDVSRLYAQAVFEVT